MSGIKTIWNLKTTFYVKSTLHYNLSVFCTHEPQYEQGVRVRVQEKVRVAKFSIKIGEDQRSGNKS